MPPRGLSTQRLSAAFLVRIRISMRCVRRILKARLGEACRAVLSSDVRGDVYGAPSGPFRAILGRLLLHRIAKGA